MKHVIRQGEHQNEKEEEEEKRKESRHMQGPAASNQISTRSLSIKGNHAGMQFSKDKHKRQETEDRRSHQAIIQRQSTDNSLVAFAAFLELFHV